MRSMVKVGKKAFRHIQDILVLESLKGGQYGVFRCICFYNGFILHK